MLAAVHNQPTFPNYVQYTARVLETDILGAVFLSTYYAFSHRFSLSRALGGSLRERPEESG